MAIDLEIIETGNGGDLVLLQDANDLSVIFGWDNMPYLAMFGGNVGFPTPVTRPEEEQAFDFWANSLLFKTNPLIQFNSLTEKRLTTVALNSSGRLLIEADVKKDIEFMRSFATLKVTVSIIAVDTVEIEIFARRKDNQEEKRFVFIWDATLGILLEDPRRYLLPPVIEPTPIPAPVADFIADDVIPDVGATVLFTDLSTNTPDSWLWVFNPDKITFIGGTTQNSKNPVVTFDTEALYTVTLTATNDEGSDDEVKVDYIDSGLVPVADFIADETAPALDVQVNFTDLSTNTPTSWLWTFTPSTVTFLNGTTSASQNPQVEFDVEDDYTVELAATNTHGTDTETKVDYISASSFVSAFSLLHDGVDEYGEMDAATPTDNVGTLAAWIKLPDSTPAATTSVIAFGDANANTLIRLYVEATTGKLTATFRQSGTNQWVIQAISQSLSDNTYAHVAVVQNGVLPVLYVNGAVESSIFVVSIDTTLWFDDITGLDTGRIGCTNWNSNGNTHFLAGNIDEVDIWNAGLNASEMTELYDLGMVLNLSTHSKVANLVNWWRMGEGAVFTGGNWEIPDDGSASDTLTTANMEVGDRVADTPP